MTGERRVERPGERPLAEAEPPPLRAGWVASAMNGALVTGDVSRTLASVSIDTRTLAPGDLFVAIRGERFDGAQFAAAAIDAGAAGVVVPRGWWTAAAGANARGAASPDPSVPRSGGGPPAVIEVDDTTAALQALARAIRRDSGAKVVAITGSAGKTTTKEATSELLSTRYRVIRNRGNFNNHIGLPLSLVELRRRPEIAVVELGMNHAGEISTLVRIAEPEVRVWTNVGDAHVGFFASVDAIADAKAEIFEGARPSDLLVANADPTGAKAALDVLASSPAARRIAVIGEMLELGDQSAELHAMVGRAAARAGLDLLLTVGGRPAGALADAAVAAGMNASHVRHLATSEDAADAAAASVGAGDLVLVKGSRGIRTDRVVDRLKTAWGG